MIKFLWAIVVTIVSSTLPYQSATAQFSDQFSDGDFINNPAWSGNDLKFGVPSNSLWLQAPAETGNAFLTTPSEAINNASWEFSIHLGFNPSSSNYARIYLITDQPDLTSPLNGYYVMIGGSSDEISLYQQSGTTQTKIIDGLDGSVNLSTLDVRVKVTRDNSGNWLLYSDVGLTGSFSLEGGVNNIAHTSASYFGIYCEYTSTRSDKFSFDDFVVAGEPYIDIRVPANFKDVIITEVFSDPSPGIQLPDAEYIEIFNRSSNEFDLNGWTLSDGSSNAKLSSRTLLPGEYLVLVSPSSIEEFLSFQNVVGVIGFPSLNNSEDVITLKSSSGATVDSVHYYHSWYNDSEKSEGGWSLELIDPNNPCSEENNWVASEDESGGSPGKQNSVFANKPDVTGPSLTNVFAYSTDHIKLDFNERLADDDILTTSISINPSIPISYARFADHTLRSITVTLGSAIQSGVLYNITLNNIRDCNLNLINDEHKTLAFALPEEADSLDIIINEILFNPLPTGVDFIELYNNSPKYVNLKYWRLGNLEEGSLQNEKTLTDSDLLFSPHSYMVVTSDPDVVIGQYPNSLHGNFLISGLPSLPDDEGSIAIVNDKGKIIDALEYNNDYHSSLIKNEDGVSLERVSFSSDSSDPHNWKSASSTVDYATPGFLNSNAWAENIQLINSIQIDPEIFQPVFGQPSFTQIIYKFDQGGNVLNAKVFDGQGRLIKTLANNDVLGTEGFYRWDGDRDDGSKARIGYYFIWFEVFNLQGEIQTFKKRVIIAGQF